MDKKVKNNNERIYSKLTVKKNSDTCCEYHF